MRQESFRVLPVRAEGVAEELKRRRQWVAWRLEERGGRQTKVPYVPHSGRRASSTDLTTWGAFEDALDSLDGYDGIGFVFSSGDPYTGVDLDACVDPKTGEIEPWAGKIVEDLDSYTELSPSGRGLHILVRGKVPVPLKLDNIEMYSIERFFTVTGHSLPERTMIRHRKEALTRLRAKYYSKPEENGKANGTYPRPVSVLEDLQVVELCRRAENVDKFERLYDTGDISDYDHDASRADQALVSMLAFYTQDPEQLDRLFQSSALYRPEKWGKRPDYRERTIEKALKGLRETYTQPSGASLDVSKNGAQETVIPSLYKEPGRRDSKPEAVKIADVKPPGPRRYVLKGIVPTPYVTLFYGDGGVAKSLLTLALALDVARGSGEWLGIEAAGGPVLYFDAELDMDEQVRRARQLGNGLGIEKLPDGLLYMSALGFGIKEALAAALETCQRDSVKLMILDSLGPALQGDAEASRDVIGFYQDFIEPFRAQGVAVLIIDHQSKLQAGQSYQSKGAFGSVFKSNLARSVLQVEAKDRGEGTLTVVVRQKKHNFGPLAEPFGIKLDFSDKSVDVEAVELDATELAEEGTLTAPERVKFALLDGPAYPREISEATGMPEKTVKNALTALRKQGVVEPTGEKEGRAEQVRLSVPTSRPHKGTGTRDDTENADWIEGAV